MNRMLPIPKSKVWINIQTFETNVFYPKCVVHMTDFNKINLLIEEGEFPISTFKGLNFFFIHLYGLP